MTSFVFVCLIITVIIEVLLAFAFKVRRRNLLVVVLAQVVTNPIVVLTSNLIYRNTNSIMGFSASLAIAELITVFIEGIMYKHFFEKYNFLNPFLLSFILNLISFIVGIVVFYLYSI